MRLCSFSCSRGMRAAARTLGPTGKEGSAASHSAELLVSCQKLYQRLQLQRGVGWGSQALMWKQLTRTGSHLKTRNLAIETKVWPRKHFRGKGNLAV